MLKNVVKPWIDQNFDGEEYVWQQDSAPSHKSKLTQAWCKTNFCKFWPWTMWPPSSPDLSPLDYGTWGYVESKACSAPHRSTDDLKATVEQEWAAMSDDYVIKTCAMFRPRVEAMIKADCGHFEN